MPTLTEFPPQTYGNRVMTLRNGLFIKTEGTEAWVSVHFHWHISPVILTSVLILCVALCVFCSCVFSQTIKPRYSKCSQGRFGNTFTACSLDDHVSLWMRQCQRMMLSSWMKNRAALDQLDATRKETREVKKLCLCFTSC